MTISILYGSHRCPITTFGSGDSMNQLGTMSAVLSKKYEAIRLST